MGKIKAGRQTETREEEGKERQQKEMGIEREKKREQKGGKA